MTRRWSSGRHSQPHQKHRFVGCWSRVDCCFFGSQGGFSGGGAIAVELRLPRRAPPRDRLLEMSREVVRCSSGDTEFSEPAVELAELDCESASSSSHPVSGAMTLLLLT